MAQLGWCTCGWIGTRRPRTVEAWLDVLVHVLLHHAEDSRLDRVAVERPFDA